MRLRVRRLVQADALQKKTQQDINAMFFTKGREVKAMTTYRTDDLEVYSLSQCLHLYVFLSEEGDRPLRIDATGFGWDGGYVLCSSPVV